MARCIHLSPDSFMPARAHTGGNSLAPWDRPCWWECLAMHIPQALLYLQSMQCKACMPETFDSKWDAAGFWDLLYEPQNYGTLAHVSFEVLFRLLTLSFQLYKCCVKQRLHQLVRDCAPASIGR